MQQMQVMGHIAHFDRTTVLVQPEGDRVFAVEPPSLSRPGRLTSTPVLPLRRHRVGLIEEVRVCVCLHGHEDAAHRPPRLLVKAVPPEDRLHTPHVRHAAVPLSISRGCALAPPSMA